ncbi:uncharacterized protein LOC121988475 [Zingiber officinale]|uniref:Uncharacterized protein n=1 Tax=Zingiber officinale TaxID=94328 RepID=A0A8J5G5U5_ZINOF|nr:uncharacterized protein LOC121988475 [Zingiber officinale]KAG6496888.1 hypothetical protein ZIOFF_044763 [Zingiber officinale]
MGNCQAILDAVVIQHADGRVERLYWPVNAADVMKANPGHHVALVTLSYSEKDGATAMKATRVRLLKSKEVLLLGHVYRLITFQEVAVALRVKKNEDVKKRQGNPQQVMKQERGRQKNSVEMVSRGRPWQPSLQSISELGG